jgi:hypothetical protein
MCEHCGTHCFCAAQKGLLPKTRSGIAALQIAAVHAVAAPQAAAPQALAVQEPAAAPQNIPQDGIAAILQYDSDE